LNASVTTSLPSPPPRPPASPPLPSGARGARELALVALVAALLFAFVLRAALFTPGVALVGQGDGEFAHAASRFVVRSWLAGDPPLWNPHVGAGAPGLGNPLLGVLDPQTLAPLLAQHFGGEAAAALALSWLAWLRLVAAAVGAFALARRLGLGSNGAWIAALSFSGAGFLGAHAVEASGRVAWLAPWILLAIERLRASNGASGRFALAFATALSIYAGQLETAFYVGLLALAWSTALLRESAAAGRSALLALGCGVALSAPALAPALEYVLRSTLAARRSANAASLDALDLGLFAILVGALWRARELGAQLLAHHAADERRQQRFAVGAAVVFALLALLIAAVAPWPDALVRTWLPDLFGRPGAGSERYWGLGRYLDSAAAWTAPFALTLALAGLLSPQLGALRNARLIRCGAAVGLALVFAAPAAVQLAHALPFTELGDPRQAGAAAALLVALLAGAAFEHASSWSRWSAASTVALGVGALVYVASRDRAPPPAQIELDAPDGIVELTRGPSEALAWGDASFEGWIHPELSVESAAVRVAPADGGRAPSRTTGHALPLPLELSKRAWRDEDVARAPQGATWFRATQLHVRDLEDGAWSFGLVLRAAGGRELAERTLAASVVHRPRRTSSPSLALVFASAFAALWLRASAKPGVTLAVVVLLGGATLHFHHGLHAVKLVDELFGPREVCERIRDAAGDGRAMTDVGVVSPHAALGHGFRAVEASDGLGLASFDAARSLMLLEGVHPVLGWNASGVDTSAPHLRLLDVRVLAQNAAVERAGWSAARSELDELGGPGERGPRREPRLLRADHPLGAASCVAEVLHPDLIARHPRDFDPAREAYLSGDIAWGPRTPFQHARVELLERRNSSIALRATLDGDGLLVVSEQRHAGWSASVDGQPAILLGVDTLFSGVGLGPGEHVVEFRYRSGALRVGLFVAALALGVLLFLRFKDRAPTRA
jgi:hypothetical protein